MALSGELKKFFEMSQDPRFIRKHNEMLRRNWEKQKHATHDQIVYALFDVTVEPAEGKSAIFKIFPDTNPVLHHKFFDGAEKEHEYWAIEYLTSKVHASYYVWHFANLEWIFYRRTTILFELEQKNMIDAVKKIH